MLLLLVDKESRKERQKKKQRRDNSLLLESETSLPNHKNSVIPSAKSRGESGNIELTLFDVKSIVAATDNFSSARKLGQGGFGPVYKGQLPDGQEIAVKRLLKNSHQGIEEFENEVLLIGKLQHRNLVRLLGYCVEGDENMLIYEFMPNKSLDCFIFDQSRKMFLDWKTRFDIILGIARGILYLHEDSRLRIIH
ncbi:G-type lectin S-receptor-like serine/threonine-protein kinase SD1-1 isoform X2 [Pistacia vera]|uniref:G-type lectin S-receptor-like serine/threonine-protein kinase SD1-1 isoform X2 n=1 Tax=Pistacia vera TaxID=55513 RepID=UPI001263614A|nr:G-type lectin S-receptor-like serine/threonine-protein kinase SD1-1 isoform X2 [Pistacia vera]